MTLSGTVDLCAVSALCILPLALMLLTHPDKMCCHFCEMYLPDDNCRTNHVTPVCILANLCVPFGCGKFLKVVFDDRYGVPGAKNGLLLSGVCQVLL